MHATPLPRWLSISILLAIATVFGNNHVAARFAFDHGVTITTAVAARSIGAALVLGALIAFGAVVALGSARH